MGKAAREAPGGYANGSSDEEVVRLRKALSAAQKQNVELQAKVDSLEEEVKKMSGQLAFPGGEPDERDKHRLLNHLMSEAYVELFASPISGVGVRAFRQIPEGVDPFPICNLHMAAKERFCICSGAELRAMPHGVFDKVKSFFAALTMDDGWTPQRSDDGEILYGVMATGMNNLNLSWYLNHSDDPNIAFQEAEEDGGYNSFVTRRKIEVGEELTTDYRELGKEFYALIAGT
mmetsp:Transcript_30795/g.57723  ORF Transcript_30795/g.57723 Transcript_30795/m.57723 type:complete len:232 (-) Transcript_30795:41-736(-)